MVDQRVIICSYADKNEIDRQELKSRENVDIGHITYMDVCQELGTVPIRLVKEQLKQTEVCLQHTGLNTNDVIALTYALLVGPYYQLTDFDILILVSRLDSLSFECKNLSCTCIQEFYVSTCTM